MYQEDYIIKKEKTDMLSSLQRIDPDIIQEELYLFSCQTIEELKEEITKELESLILQCQDDIASKIFFKELLKHENTSAQIYTEDDFQGFLVFLYKEKGSIHYYIPDEIKEILKKVVA